MWYLHRPFLAVYFPTVASLADSDNAEPTSLASKATLLLCTTVIVGMVLRSLSDIGVASLFSDESNSSKSHRWPRRIARWVVRLFLIGPARDPRVQSIDRYLNSPRRARFLILAKSWGFAEESKLDRNEEKVLAHQHIVTRVKAFSIDSRALVSEAFQPVTVFSGLFVSLLALFGGGALSFASNWAIADRAITHSPTLLTIGIAAIYAATAAVGYALRRAMRQFSAQVVTLALHLHDALDRPNKAPEPTTTAVTPRATFPVSE